MTEGSVIEARDLTKTYDTAIAVDHITFSVGRGEIFGLLGPNGAGKTTTILMLLGLTEISSGEVSVLGFNPAREPLSVKRRVGYLPDTVYLRPGPPGTTAILLEVSVESWPGWVQSSSKGA